MDISAPNRIIAKGISMKTRWLWLLCTLSPTLILTPTLALAENDHDNDHNLAWELKQAGDILPLEKILEKAQRLHSGNVLEVELERKKLRYIYEIETVDTKGSVWEMRFDAKTAELLNSNNKK